MKTKKMRKSFLSLLLATAVTLSLCPAAAPVQAQTTEKANSVSWDGTSLSEPVLEDDTYQIGTAAELAWFADHVNQLSDADTGAVAVNAVLTDDIHLGSHEWTPIGLNAKGYITDGYGGTFDGQNHTVSGLKINAATAGYGLFGAVYTGTVKNLRVEGDVNSSNVAGGIVGKLQDGTLENCSMSGSVTSTGATAKGYAGGIVGNVLGVNTASTIKGCCNTARVSGSYAGGIIGCNNVNNYTGVIAYCYNTGTITSTDPSKGRCGGIAGQQSKGSISSCYNIGECKNGIYGFSNATITNCYYLESKLSDEGPETGGTPTGTPQPIEDAESLLASLNSGVEKLFAAGTANQNDGYPLLLWQLSASVISVPVTSVRLLGDVVTGHTVTAQALGEGEETATNTTYQWAVSEDKKTFTDLEGATSGHFDIPDTAGYVGKYLRVTVTGEEGSSASAVSSPIAKSGALILKENEEKVREAKASLTLDTDIIKESGTLKLPAEYKDCSIRWASSNPSIISDEGIVTLPDKNIVSVTLTATVTCGGASDTKEFPIDVWSKDVDAGVYLQRILDTMKWNFKLLQPVFGTDTNILVKFKNILKAKGLDGVSITIHSTADETLVSKNGKIFYPAIPEGTSGADGRQVKVFFDLSLDGETVIYPESDIYALLIPWDTGDVRTALEESVDKALTDSALLDSNDSLSAVVSDLTLPSCIEGDKYSFAQITWTSSDEAHLDISSENRQGSADSFYLPYVGKVYQDGTSHDITLTAVIKNPSTGITLTRTFDIVVPPLSGEQLNQTLETMTGILDCYTADKLTDYVTKKPLVTTEVENDIQLVIPKNVVTASELASLGYGAHWDYWNYKFTVTSSDTDIIDINSFRAYVYRPLGEDSSADKTVTLTVKMAVKGNPNLFVTKNIPVTVKHLARAEINHSLELMDRAKEGYARGLLGANTDVYSIVDDLTPYREIVWNSDASGIDFIYRHADMKNSGICVDELPGWESQEDWRLFRSSDRDLLASETLILNKTPEQNSFIRINSVLTDEIFGKYYNKFYQDSSYDAEALEKFRQLYKQPVSAYMMAVGSGNYTETFTSMSLDTKASLYQDALTAYKNETDRPIRVSFTLLGPDGAEIIPRTEEASFTGGATVFDVFRKLLDDHGIPYEARGSYISSINGLAEFAHGQNSGWMYTVGSVFVNSYMNAQVLYGGEDIVVKYVMDYTTANMTEQDPGTGGSPATGKDPGTEKEPDQDKKQETPAASGSENGGKTEQPQKKQEQEKKSEPEKKTAGKKKKTIKTLKLKKYKRGTKRITGRTLKKAKVVVKAGKKKYTVKANKKGNFTVKLKKKLKRKMKIRVTVSKSGYRKKTKTFKVK